MICLVIIHSFTHRGLILHRPLGPSAPKISTNDWLRIGSTFHSLHAIAAEASPVKLPGNKNPGSFYNIIRLFYYISSIANIELIYPNATNTSVFY